MSRRGTKKHPYCNIQLAEDNSLPDYKIKVKSGEYGAVIVDVDGLTFQKSSSPVVDCGGAGNGFEILSMEYPLLDLRLQIVTMVSLLIQLLIH